MSIGPLHTEARTRTLTGVQILGTGRYLPDNVITNHDLLASHGLTPTGSSTEPGSPKDGSPCPTRQPATWPFPPPIAA